MTKVIAAAVLSLGVAFAAAALAQESRSTPAVTLHVVSPTGEAPLLRWITATSLWRSRIVKSVSESRATLS
jgi:hypothetical protein